MGHHGYYSLSDESDYEVSSPIELTKTKSSGPKSYNAVKGLLLIKPHHFQSLPISPKTTSLPSNLLADLMLHPALESALHILNYDLSSAHFLLRHMQQAPAYEAMFLHGILHRVEGDYDNARAWYNNVSDSEVFRSAWPGESGRHEAMEFLDEIEGWRMENPGRRRSGDDKKSYERRENELRRRSLEELKRVLVFCEGKFGTERVEDASGVWVRMGTEHREKAQGMVTGGEGWREF